MAGEPGWVPPGVDIKREGFELVDPGVVHIPQWRPDSPPGAASDPGQFWGGLVGVARKP